MKIVAYSKVPATVPFVHLGYLATSTTIIKPAPGLLFGGIVLSVAGVSLIGKRLWQHGESTKPVSPGGLRTRRRVRVGFTLLLFAALVLCSACIFGEKRRIYHHPDGATRVYAEVLSGRLVPPSEARSGEYWMAILPTREGEYDLSTAVEMAPNIRRSHRYERLFSDGWNTPFRLRLTQQDNGLKYVIVSAGPDRITGTPDDIVFPATRNK